MNKFVIHSSRSVNVDEQRDGGFTLVEILIAIVLVGILSAVVVVGISNLTSKGSTSACAASADAARAGSVVYYASRLVYPTTFNQLTTPVVGPPAIPAALTLPSGAAINTAPVTVAPTAGTGMQVTTGSWQLTMTVAGTATTAPTFVCTP